MTLVDNLLAMRGVWQDHMTAWTPAGDAMPYDEFGGQPGPFPYDNLVYVDFDGERYEQTNVTFRGRPLHVRTFTGRVVDGVLEFDALGPDDPGHIGVGGGPGVIVYLPRRLDRESLQRFSDPDVITFDGRTRSRITTLYRGAELVRVCTVDGVRLSNDPTLRVSWDPRGEAGPVHAMRSVTNVYVDAVGTPDADEVLK